MKTIIINCSPTDFFTLTVSENGVVQEPIKQITLDKIQEVAYSLLNTDSKIYLVGSQTYTTKIKNYLKEYILTKNSTFENVEIILL